MKYLALALVACGGAATGSAPVAHHETPSEHLVDKVAHRDLPGIEEMFATPLSYGGLWFSDPACTQQFPTQGKIDKDRLPAFARCLATLPLTVSPRHHAQADIWVLDYAPGFEIEIQVARVANGREIRWIGYAGRRDAADALPTISGEALAAMRTDHTPAPSGADFTWFKICLDATGAVTGMHARETSSPDAEQALGEVVKRWTFAPFASGVPVCAMTRVPSTDKEVLPFDVAIAPGEHALIAFEATKRLDGEKLIVPDDADKVLIQRTGIGGVSASLEACFDERGAMESVHVIKPSGLPGYDRKIAVTMMQTWRYAPTLQHGAPIKACTVVTFHYSQEGGSMPGRSPNNTNHQIPVGPRVPTPRSY